VVLNGFQSFVELAKRKASYGLLSEKHRRNMVGLVFALYAFCTLVFVAVDV